MKKLFSICAFSFSLFLFSCEEKQIITIGSGSPNARYYPVVTSICETFNKYNQDKNIICQAKVSKGADYNLNAVANDEFDMGIAQHSLYDDFVVGRNNFEDNPHDNLQLLLNLHKEYFTIIAKKHSLIKSFSDLKGKKVNIGNQGSGSRLLFERIIKELSWSLNDFSEIYDYSGSKINKVLCEEDKADAAVYLVGHPNQSFDYILNNCNSHLVSLSKSEVEKLIKISPKYFHQALIPAGSYKSNPDSVYSFASQTVLFVSKELDKKIVEKFLQLLEDRQDELIIKLTKVKKQ